MSILIWVVAHGISFIHIGTVKFGAVDRRHLASKSSITLDLFIYCLTCQKRGKPQSYPTFLYSKLI